MTALGRILVAGGSGQLGSVITRDLLAGGVPVRALARRSEPLRALADAGAEVIAADLTDARATREALDGVDQIISTANNVMGTGASSPHRVDVRAYWTLLAAARETGVRRLIHVSAREITPDSVVDFFRVKSAVDEVVRTGGVPFVLLQFTAFMDVWAGVVLGDAARPGTATLFGGGTRVMNFIAVEDVSRFVVAVAHEASIVGEAIQIGGPTNATLAELAESAEQALGTPIRRRRVPAAVLRVARRAVRPFSERVARMVSMGYWCTLADRPFDGWRAAADRFRIRPRTLESYLAARYGGKM
jgi:NADH dehydrogenase